MEVWSEEPVHLPVGHIPFREPPCPGRQVGDGQDGRSLDVGFIFWPGDRDVKADAAAWLPPLWTDRALPIFQR